MISDFVLLGIAENSAEAEIKRAYRAKAKELHPDVSRPDESSGDAVKRHYLFVAVCQAYQRLLTRAAPAGERQKPASGTGRRTAERSPKPASERVRGGVAAHADPAYAFYKAGMKYFMLIHPSQWKLAADDDDPERGRQKILEVVKLFPKAYYYFSLVAHEFPESQWAHDARVKMNLLEERTLRYKSIIESFSSWKADKKKRSAK